QVGDVPGEFVRPRRRFAAPEWHVRCRSRGVLHENFSGLHAAYAPGSVSQQHDVSGKALDGEVFVHGANDRAFRMRYDGIQRVFRDGPAVKIALTNGAHERGAFEQVVTRRDEEPAFGNRSAPVASAADALQGRSDGAWRTNLADQIHAADIDSQFERSRGDERADL